MKVNLREAVEGAQIEKNELMFLGGFLCKLEVKAQYRKSRLYFYSNYSTVTTSNFSKI